MRFPRFTRRRFLRNLILFGGTLLGAAALKNHMASRPRFPISDHCDGAQFFNPGTHVNRTWWDVLKWKRTSTASPWPETVAIDPPALPKAPLDGTVCATWINHASVLLQTRHANILTDPVFSDRVSPLSWAGPKRVHPPAIAVEDLPDIHVILLSHDHFDHCDQASLRHFASLPHPPIVVTPLGNGALLREFGFRDERIIELDWWEAHEFAHGFHVRATPARHWSNRVMGSRNRRLWSGFFLQVGGRTVYYTGDTAWDDFMFADIRKRCGEPDLALIPIGAYEPRWFMASQHCNPAEAVRIHQTVGAVTSIGVHWGTFQLTDEEREAPPQALEIAKEQASIPPASFQALAVGGSITV
ncbi:MAG: MBL fold metallo-hydrolase [Opitutaceae bacterium]|nr:MBL fold metallo-hydrolase [Opitutaceae bacterium]